MVLQETDKLYTVDEFLAFINQPEFEGKRIELREGSIIEVPPSSKKNVMLESWLITLLNNFVIPRGLGVVSTPNGGYKISGRSYLQPDVAFIHKDRAGGIDGVTFPTAPDLAVEVISPSENGHMVTSKARLYLQAGTTIVWAVYPDEKGIDEYRLSADGSLAVRSFGLNDTLTAADVLPEFNVTVREIFKVIE
jgi:Uma2 family endonuclease